MYWSGCWFVVPFEQYWSILYHYKVPKSLEKFTVTYCNMFRPTSDALPNMSFEWFWVRHAATSAPSLPCPRTAAPTWWKSTFRVKMLSCLLCTVPIKKDPQTHITINKISSSPHHHHHHQQQHQHHHCHPSPLGTFSGSWGSPASWIAVAAAALAFQPLQTRFVVKILERNKMQQKVMAKDGKGCNGKFVLINRPPPPPLEGFGYPSIKKPSQPKTFSTKKSWGFGELKQN